MGSPKCNLRLSKLEPIHAVIAQYNDKIYIENHASTFIIIGEEKIAPNDWAQLRAGDTIDLVTARHTFQVSINWGEVSQVQQSQVQTPQIIPTVKTEQMRYQPLHIQVPQNQVQLVMQPQTQPTAVGLPPNFLELYKFYQFMNQNAVTSNNNNIPMMNNAPMMSVEAFAAAISNQ